MVAAVLLVVLLVAVTVQWFRHPTVARTHSRNPQMAHFYGAAPMALMTVGSGAILVGKDLIGTRVAVDLAWVLWTAGTVGGLFTAATIPFLMFTQHNVEPDAAFGGWLMPVVPPMVSAAAGALLIPHMAPGTGRTTMLYGCYAMFGLSLFAALIIISMIWSRLALYGTSGHGAGADAVDRAGPAGAGHHGGGPARWRAALAVPAELAGAMNVFAVLFGVPVWGFALLWIVLATRVDGAHAAARHAVRADVVEPDVPRRHVRDGHHAVGGAHRPARVQGGGRRRLRRPACTWGLVAVRTARGSVRGNLFVPPPANAGPVKAKKDPPPASVARAPCAHRRRGWPWKLDRSSGALTDARAACLPARVGCE